MFLLAFLSAGGAVSAHHGAAAYDRSEGTQK
jgi:hypothetical protein